MTEQRKAVIKNADMSEDMQQEAVDCASQALSKYNIEKVSERGGKTRQRPLLCCGNWLALEIQRQRERGVLPLPTSVPGGQTIVKGGSRCRGWNDGEGVAAEIETGTSAQKASLFQTVHFADTLDD